MSHKSRQFEQLVCIGRGGFGEVYRATWRRPEGLSVEVALKVLRSDVDPSGQAAARMRDEGRLLSSLRHPNIVSVHDMVSVRGRAALVTEYVEGEDLTGILAGDASMPLRPLVEVVHEVAVAMEAAWRFTVSEGRPGLVHRDIKPSNIRVGRYGQVKLLDFGLARLDTQAREAHTQTGDIMGTTSYMAPERFLEGNSGVASDVFSLGAVLYEGLTGVRWYGDLSLPRIVGVIGSPDHYQAYAAEQMKRVPQEVPEELTRLVQEMLSYGVDGRPDLERLVRGTEELADALPAPGLARWCKGRSWAEGPLLEGALSGQTVLEEAALASLSSRSTRLGSGRRWSGLLLACLCGVLGWALWPDSPQSPLPSSPVENVAEEVVLNAPDDASQELEEEPAPAEELAPTTAATQAVQSSPEPVQPSPEPVRVKRAVAPRTAVEPASPPVVPPPITPAPGPPTMQRAMVRLDRATDVTVSLDGPEGTVVMVPGAQRRVASGRYTVEARFGERIDRSLQVDLRPQTPVTLLCIARFERCRVSEGASPSRP